MSSVPYNVLYGVVFVALVIALSLYVFDNERENYATPTVTTKPITTSPPTVTTKPITTITTSPPKTFTVRTQMGSVTQR